jgi:hypothetical protein
MITQAESRKSIVEINLPEGVFGGFEKAKDFLNETTQQTKESLSATAGKAVNTITTATDKAVDTVSATAKGSLEQTLQKADQLSDVSSNAIQMAISDSVSEWLQAHPVVFHLVQLLLWAANHPIISLIILVFTVAITWSLIKALGRLIEMAGWSLLKAPFKFGQVLIAVSAKSLGEFGGLAVQRAEGAEGEKNKQQRLVEISTRLEAIQKEQSELLQEAATILASDRQDECIREKQSGKNCQSSD